MKMSNHRQSTVSIAIVGLFCLWAQPIALSAPPDNAALLYYQAGIERLRLQEPEGFWRAGQQDSPPDKVVRQFLSRDECRAVIELVNAATEVSQCDWGLMASGRWRMGSFATTLRSLGTWLSIDARIQAADGHYRAAFKTAMRLRRFARHVGDKLLAMWEISETLDAKAFALIQHILAVMPPDADTLTWLKQQLVRGEGAPWHPREAFANWRDMEIRCWQASPEVYAYWKDVSLRAMKDEAAVEELKKLPQAELLERMQAAYNLFLNSAVEIFESDLPYQDTCTQIKQLIEQIHAQGQKGSAIAFMYSCTDPADDYYTMHINAKARANAVRAALEVYRIRAETGRLPEALPDGLPGDPYSSQDFAYQITEEGFALRCRAMALGYSQGPRQFDFKVRQDTAN